MKKQISLIREHFTMDVAEGKLELRELVGFAGRNFIITLNDRELGVVMENMEFILNNIVFDNSVLVSYDDSNLPLLTAMAIMVARDRK